MLASVKKTLINLVILTAIIVIGVLMYSHNRTYFNEVDEIGNTAGNIYNGGLFCEQDKKIFFSNDYDDGSLYVMNSDCTNFKKVHKDKVAFINTDGNYVYYVRANNTKLNNSGSILVFNNTGVYRINQNGSNIMAISSKPASYLTLSGNFLYLQRYDVKSGLFFYRYQIDGKLERLLLKDAVIPNAFINNTLYYSGSSMDHNIHSLDLSSFVDKTQHVGSYAYPIYKGNYIYYINIKDNYSIYRMDLDGSNPTQLVNERISTYNITNSGKFLYYQVDDMKNNRMCRLNLETMEATTLLEGNYKQIHVTEKYVFFKEFENINTFIIDADGTTKISTFNPPNLNQD